MNPFVVRCELTTQCELVWIPCIGVRGVSVHPV